jgi:multiple sugar transport system permease protein
MADVTLFRPGRDGGLVTTPRGVRPRRFLMGVAEHALPIVLGLAFVLPLFVCVSTAFMTQHQAGTGSLWPSPWHFSNFRDVFSAMPFARDLWNTILYAGLSSIGVVLSSVPVAYAVARMNWRGRDAFFLVILATMMIPAQVTSLPLYVLFAKIGWIGSLKPLIVPSFFGDAFSIFLLRQFFLTLPQETIEAARVDGAGEFRILGRVVIPMARPAIAAVGLFAFMYAWNDFYNPLLYTGNSTTSQTLAVGLSTLAKSAHQSAYQLQMAASLMFLLPVLILFLFAQKVFIEGIAMTGSKG